MPPIDPHEIERQMFLRVQEGDGRAKEDLVALIYGDMRRLAHLYVSRPSMAHTLHTTALVHEAFLKMSPDGELSVRDRDHFMALLAHCMRSVVVDHVRRGRRVKRTPAGTRVPMQDVAECFEERTGDLVALDEALQRLEAFDPTSAQIVEMRFFGDLSVREIANILGVSTRTVERDWQAARAFLRRELA